MVQQRLVFEIQTLVGGQQCRAEKQHLCQSPVTAEISPNSPQPEWFNQILIPWYHYVPVKVDYSDL